MTCLAEIVFSPTRLERYFIEANPEPKAGDCLNIAGHRVQVMLSVRQTRPAECRDDAENENGTFFRCSTFDVDPFPLELICVPVDIAALARQEENIIPVTFARREESEVQV